MIAARRLECLAASRGPEYEAERVRRDRSAEEMYQAQPRLQRGESAEMAAVKAAQTPEALTDALASVWQLGEASRASIARDIGSVPFEDARAAALEVLKAPGVRNAPGLFRSKLKAMTAC